MFNVAEGKYNLTLIPFYLLQKRVIYELEYIPILNYFCQKGFDAGDHRSNST